MSAMARARCRSSSSGIADRGGIPSSGVTVEAKTGSFKGRRAIRPTKLLHLSAAAALCVRVSLRRRRNGIAGWSLPGEAGDVESVQVRSSGHSWGLKGTAVMELRDVAIVGVYATRQARVIEDASSLQLTWQAVTGAVSDAGLTLEEIDGAAIDFPGPGGVRGDCTSWARLLGHPLRFVADGMLDTAGARGALKAAGAIAAGLCEVAVVGGAAASGPAVPGGGSPTFHADATPGPGRSVALGSGRDPWGGYVAANFALVAQRHMHEFGTTRQQMAEVAAIIRNNGHVNPEAVMYRRGPYTAQDVLDSRPIASPFNLLDVCLVAQGGAAVVLTTVERARDLRHGVVQLLGGAMEFNRAAWTGGSAYRECGSLGVEAARRMYGQANVAPGDTDVFCLYDPTSFEVIRQFEMLGLCGEGEGGPFTEGGQISLDGRYPTNPDGGCLSYAWNGTQQMTLKLVEAVLQLRGDAVGRQVPGCRVAVVTNAGSGAQHVEMACLGRL
jgi:acetyl-CoA acetyltransferase